MNPISNDTRNHYRTRPVGTLAAAIAVALMAGCQWFVDDADREVYRIIAQRQMDALGETHDATIHKETVPLAVGSDPYDFTPHPVDPSLPDAYTRPSTQPSRGGLSETTDGSPTEIDSESDAPSEAPPYGERPGMIQSTQDEAGVAGPDAQRPNPMADLEAFRRSLPQELPRLTTTVPATQPNEMLLQLPDISWAAATTQPASDARMLTLSEALKQSLETGRAYQSAKEALYLAVLDLTLERHFWTPRLFGDVQARFADFGQIRDFDRAMEAVSTVGVRQNLPYGGELTARLINTLARDLGRHITTGESGALLVEANIPLLRGAGRVAYESRYRSEREVIYSVRAFERFRREWLVDVASAYFSLLSSKQQLVNAYREVENTEQATRFMVKRAMLEIELPVDAQQSIVQLLNALISLERTKADYEDEKDRFKILIGLSTDESIDVPVLEDLEAELNASLIVPDVDQAAAVETALRYRLDLITDLDRIDDARRGEVIARNGLLPDLNFTGSVQVATDPDHLNSMDFNLERTTWRGSLDLELPLDRKAERNAYRRSLILVRRAERDYSLAMDNVRRQARDAKRRLELALFQLESEDASVRISEERLRATEFQYENPPVVARGRTLDIRDLLDALLQLRQARDGRSRQQSQVWIRILEFQLASGTLRVDDDGRWVEFEPRP